MTNSNFWNEAEKIVYKILQTGESYHFMLVSNIVKGLSEAGLLVELETGIAHGELCSQGFGVEWSIDSCSDSADWGCEKVWRPVE